MLSSRAGSGRARSRYGQARPEIRGFSPDGQGGLRIRGCHHGDSERGLRFRRARRPSGQGIRDQPITGQLRIVQVAPHQSIPADVRFTHDTRRNRLLQFIENVNPGVRNRFADRDRTTFKALVALDGIEGSKRRRFRRAIAVDQHRRRLGSAFPGVRDGKNVAADEHLPQRRQARKERLSTISSNKPVVRNTMLTLCQRMVSRNSAMDRRLPVGMASVAPFSKAPQISKIDASKATSADNRNTSSALMDA